MQSWPVVYLCFLLFAPVAQANDVLASPPTALSVTIYRAPYRNGGPINLNNLGGFALVTEIRQVRLPPGLSRLRFEGVVDGLEPATAIVTGLPGGVIEKNRDAALLSPEALLRSMIGTDITLIRTQRRTGKVTAIRATIRSANSDGVIFETAQGVEALWCAGLAEATRFSAIPTGLSATPTLSVLTRTDHEINATVTLSYLATGFDWSADYVAQINADGQTLDLGAWITLANGNGVSLPDAAVQVVAGKLNREGVDNFITNVRLTVIARCWPRGTTSDQLPHHDITMVHPDGVFGFGGASIEEVVVTGMRREMISAPSPLALRAPAPPPPPPEQLGDLKLYRVSHPTTVAARQSKQVRLLEAKQTPFTRLTQADLQATGSSPLAPASVLLRSKNDEAHHLGFPLPAGSIALFQKAKDRDMLTSHIQLADTALDEDLELRLGVAPDVQVRQTRLAVTGHQTREKVEITNARSTPTQFELRLQIGGAQKVISADHLMASKDGRPIFRLTLPANSAVTVNYEVADK